ncbi:MAG: response regulator [Myxococcota bacterium]
MRIEPRTEPIAILLVEDNLGDAELTELGLKRARVLNRVHVVEDGESALAFLRREGRYAAAPRPDLIFLDLNLPRMDGREFLTVLKADPALNHIPVVVLTSSEAEEDILRAYKLQASCYVKKPVLFEEFLRTIERIDEFWLSVVRLPRVAS